jgi:OOP family OmpA-OmpF porin
MKKFKMLKVMVLVLALVFAAGSGMARAVDKCPDNFVFLVDQSGSMYMHIVGSQVKMAIAKKVLLGVNEMIPDMRYNAALQMFAPVQTVVPVGPYDRAAMAKGIKSIKDDQDIFGRLTPMGPGIMALDPVLAKMSGNTAVILVSDGMANQGPDPVEEARAIYSKYPNVCIHIISLADASDKKGKEILTAINKLNTCSVMAQGVALECDAAAMEKFVSSIFCTPKKPVKEEVIVLRGINFDFDKSNIKPEFRPVLDEGASILMKNPDIRVVIEGHTDAMGSVEYNQRLSERRAAAVYDYFLNKGVSSSRMRSVGYSELRPVATNATEEGRALNRRVELKVEK